MNYRLAQASRTDRTRPQTARLVPRPPPQIHPANRPATRANTDSNSQSHQPASATLPCPEQRSRPAQATISDWSSEPSTLKVWSMLPVEPTGQVKHAAGAAS
ncbi:hypothetical protein SAV14893_084000 [Streptomyces avermitilis]|uniref:Uncharacterized protein n=1 Tax=Streptomyces avermitilis TaxID=33903 RepID=A0A4D4MF48_STRAX|nr:hypothetical protein SAVMC3_00970 [Streptomyces avermitilis]GDY69007.1 hypothetical protein SAV14893_084000 [Streptomyces avermitilis]GDY70611.1 hypothetical protein SAV31267_000960 [Streptomyces avermitilis]